MDPIRKGLAMASNEGLETAAVFLECMAKHRDIEARKIEKEAGQAPFLIGIFHKISLQKTAKTLRGESQLLWNQAQHIRGIKDRSV